jgi:CAAX protease family protein
VNRARPFLTLLLGILAAALTGAVARGLGLSLSSTEASLAVVLVIVYLASVRWIERAPLPEQGGRWAWTGLLGGAGLGMALFAAVMLLLLLAGVYRISGVTAGRVVTAGAALALMTAITEEVLFRGMFFRALAGTVGTWWALAVTSAFFGAAHAFNPGATVVSSVAVALEAGVLLGAAYAVTGQLWLPIGLHAGWNFAEASIFGMTESGVVHGRGVLRGALHGPTILTGGAFGPEATVVALVVCLPTAGYLLRWARRSGMIVAPVWSTR